MANLNLSEFTEKLFVADADHTFIWDTANAISKRVSRNSWLNSGELTSSAPVTISQTWNAGSNVMTALKVVATDTASGATSNLLELWAGSTPALDFAVTKAGVMQVYGTYSSAGANYARLALACDSSGNATISTQALGTGTAGVLAFSPGNSERMRITTAGNVGIGTTAPGAKLQVVGNAIFGENSISTSIVNVSFGGSYGTAVAGSKANLKWDLFNDGAGNRSGIGISSGIFEFQVSAGAGFGFYPNGSTTSALQIISSGNVGIGTTSPTSKLQVTNGDVEIETVTSGIIMKAAGTANRYRITLNAGGTDFVITAL